MKRLLMILTATMLLFGCTKAPTEEAVGSAPVGMAVASMADPAAPPVFPARYEKTLSFDGLEVQIDADVVVPPLGVFPIYILEPMRFTQEQADRMIAGLLDGAELYDETNAYNRRCIQGLIDEYAAEIAACTGDTECADLIPIFVGYIDRLKAEYQAAPEDSTYTPACRTLLPKDTQVARMLYGTEQVREDGVVDYAWSKEAQRRAAADGYGVISGVCRQSNGRKMVLLLENTSDSRLSFAPPDDAGAQSAGADFSEAEASARGAALLKAMGLDAEQLSVRRVEPDGAEAFCQLRYRTAVPGTAGACTVPLVCCSETDELRSTVQTAVPEESIRLSLDDGGVYAFSWDNPVRVKAVEQTSVSLCPWETVTEIVDMMFGVKQYWQYDSDRNDPMIVGRRIEVSTIRLSYMQVMRGNDLSERAYIPVWDVCGRLVYCCDAQGSRSEHIVTAQEDAEFYSLLTINAIDGTVIDRY